MTGTTFIGLMLVVALIFCTTFIGYKAGYYQGKVEIYSGMFNHQAALAEALNE
jgi:hypothetical protein